jgi:hypothetical protein
MGKSSFIRVHSDLKNLIDKIIKDYEDKFNIKITTQEATKLLAKKIK